MLREDVSILIVDDVNAMRTQVKEILNSMGFRKTVSAGSAQEAKQAIEMNPFQLVLSDWHMEPTSGLELLKYIRMSERHRIISFIMISADSTKEKVLEAIQCGVDDYLVKPITAFQMESKILKLLLKKQVL